MKRLLGAVLFASALTVTSAAHATNYFGTIQIVAPSGTSGTIKFVTSGANSVSLFASTDNKDIMLQGFYRKAKMSIGYTPGPCISGNGPCGTVFTVIVDAPNF